MIIILDANDDDARSELHSLADRFGAAIYEYAEVTVRDNETGETL